MTAYRAIVVAAVVCTLAVMGCSRSKPAGQAEVGIRVTEIQLGRSAGPDKTVGDVTDRFNPGDTFFAAVRTEGTSAGSTLKARWTYEDGQVVSEDSLTIAATGPASTLFHVDKPDGWPEGEYAVEIFLDGISAGTKRFKVR